MPKRYFRFLIISCIFIVLFLSSLLLGMGYYYRERIIPGVSIYGQSMGGLLVLDAAEKLEEMAADFHTRPIELFVGEQSWVLSPAQLGIDINREETLDTVFQLGRQGTLWERIQLWWCAWRQGYEVSIALLVDEEALDQCLQDLAQEINQRPQNASLDLATLEVIPGYPGRELEQTASREKLLRNIVNPGFSEMSLVVSEIAPLTTTEDIALLDGIDVLSRSVTVFEREAENRTTNIKLATCAINGVILLPGEVFSFNEVVGPRGPEYGFVEAPELVNFELVPGYGGGICQVASTLFHAALLAGLDVVEHHNHSRPSTYISMGLDATVAYDYLDLKLGNNGVSPVLFVAGIGEDRLEVAIVGKKWTPETIRLEIGEIEEIPPPVEQVVDPTLLPGEILEEEKGLSGYKVKVERINMLYGQELFREVISDSYYAPRPQVIRLGPTA